MVEKVATTERTKLEDLLIGDDTALFDTVQTSCWISPNPLKYADVATFRYFDSSR